MTNTFEIWGPNTGALSTPDIRNANKLTNQEITTSGNGNPGKVLELVGAASSIAGVAGATPEGVHDAFKAIDERWNPQLFAENSAKGMAATGIDVNAATSLAAFEANLVATRVVNGRNITPENPAAVVIAGKEILAGRHADNMVALAATPGDVDVIDPDNYINTNRTTGAPPPAGIRIDATLEQQIRTRADAKITARLNQVTADFAAGNLSITEVEAIIGKAGVNPKLKAGLERMLAAPKKVEQTKTGSTTEAAAIAGMTPDQIAAKLITTVGYTAASAETKAAIDAQLAVNKKGREVALQNEKDDKDLLKLTQKEEKIKMRDSSRKEVLAKLKIALKWGGGLAILFALGGPGALALVAGGGGAAIGTLGMVSGGAGFAGLLVGGTLGFTVLSGRNADVVKSQKEKLLAAKALREAQKKEPELDAAQKRRRLTEKVSAVQQYAQFYSQGNGYDPALVAAEIMKGTKMDSVDALLRAIS